MPLNTYKYAQPTDPNDKPVPFITSLTQYTAEITDEYLQKFTNPYRFSDATLHIYQNSLRVDSRPKSISNLFDTMCVASGIEIPPGVPMIEKKDQQEEPHESLEKYDWKWLLEQAEQERALAALENEWSDTEVADDDHDTEVTEHETGNEMDVE